MPARHRRMETLLSRVLTSFAAAVAAIVLLSIATLFLCGALYLCLVSMSTTPSLAALLVGLAALIVAGLLILAARLAARRSPVGRTSGATVPASSDAADNLDTLAANLGRVVACELSSLARAHPYHAFGLSLFAGLAVGASRELSDMLNTVLENKSR